MSKEYYKHDLNKSKTGNKAKTCTASSHSHMMAIAIAFMTCVMVLFGTSILTFAKSQNAKKPVYKYYTSYEIQSGDTLWTIADAYTKGYDVDRRDYINELQRLNHLNASSDITSGQYLTIAYYSDEVK